MVREKVAPEYLEEEVEYNQEHWLHFKELRNITYQVMQALRKFSPIVHGSVARGDITVKSDIDIIISYQVKEFQVNYGMESIGYKPIERWIVQATPLSALKGVIIYSSTPELSITLPLIPFYPREQEFYTFGGALTYKDLSEDRLKRVPGVTKQLLFIEPTEKGHKAYRINLENASQFAKLLSIKVDTIYERIRVLERRDEKGRTGIFKKRLLKPEESFGGVLKELSESDPATRRRIQRKKI
ncbi:MAG: nucleotidyltransferase domain-containing protein [Candidatus Helarchaeota archaeon]